MPILYSLQVLTHLLNCRANRPWFSGPSQVSHYLAAVCFSVALCPGLSCLRLPLLLQVVRFPEAVEAAVEELMPNRITDYLYDLSEKFNGFYTECHVSLQALCSVVECTCGIYIG